jgi:hypothetical protein
LLSGVLVELPWLDVLLLDPLGLLLEVLLDPLGLLLAAPEPLSMLLPLLLPETVRLSVTLRLPAKEEAIRLASSRSLEEGTVPLSSTALSVTFTEMFALVRVGSLRNAV